MYLSVVKSARDQQLKSLFLAVIPGSACAELADITRNPVFYMYFSVMKSTKNHRLKKLAALGSSLRLKIFQSTPHTKKYFLYVSGISNFNVNLLRPELSNANGITVILSMNYLTLTGHDMKKETSACLLESYFLTRERMVLVECVAGLPDIYYSEFGGGNSQDFTAIRLQSKNTYFELKRLAEITIPIQA